MSQSSATLPGGLVDQDHSTAGQQYGSADLCYSEMHVPKK